MLQNFQNYTSTGCFWLLAMLLLSTPAWAVTTPQPHSALATIAMALQQQRAQVAADTTPVNYRDLRRIDKDLRRLERAERALLNAERRGRLPKLHDSARGFAISSFVLGVFGVGSFFIAVLAFEPAFPLILCIVSFVLATIFGIIAMRRTKFGALGPRGLAIVGFILGLLGLGFWVFVLITIAIFGF